jgi:hypothetical protein
MRKRHGHGFGDVVERSVVRGNKLIVTIRNQFDNYFINQDESYMGSMMRNTSVLQTVRFY